MGKRREGLTNRCMVIVSLHDDGAATWRELRDRTGLSYDQLSAVLVDLQKDKKIIVLEERHSHEGGNIYAFNDEWNPSMCIADKVRWHKQTPEQKARRSEARIAQARVARVRKVVDREVERLPPYIRFRDKKLAVLRKLLDRVSPDDRDVLLGIIADYERGIKKKDGEWVHVLSDESEVSGSG